MNREENDPRTEEFAARLLETALKAEQLLPPLEIILALLGVAVNYALRRAPESEVVELLRETAARMERLQAPRGPAN